ncbi:MAG: HD-GYP domain-containing protein [Candidatus Krumholzibacteriia bacterium]
MATAVDRHCGVGLVEGGAGDAGARRPAGNSPPAAAAAPGAEGATLTLFVAMLCALLRQSLQAGWLAREVIEGTRTVARLAATLHAAAGGFTLRLGGDHFRHEESGQRCELSGKAVLQLHRFFLRRGLTGARFAADVSPLAIKNLARALLEPATDVALLFPAGCGLEPFGARADGPEVQILRGETHEEAPAPRQSDGRPGRVSDPLKARADQGGAAPRPAATPAATPRAAGMSDRDLQQLRQENAAIREAVAATVTVGGRAPHPAILTCIEAMEQDEHLMHMLVSLRQHDRYTFDHSCNVALLAVAIARQIGVAGEELRRFAGAVLLHDIGKLYTPLAVLNKPGRFSPDEWQVMKRHPVDGMEILAGAGFKNLYSERVTLLHHVNYEGQGYPSTTAQRPDLLAHIVQVADIYDAFTSIRPYRQQARPREVLETLRAGAGKDFDPAVVTAALKLMGETPMGAVLKLDNGQLGLVVDMGSSPDGRPVVRVIQDELGNRPARTTLVDLSARIPATGEYMVDVVEAIDPVIRNIPIGRYI